MRREVLREIANLIEEIEMWDIKYPRILDWKNKAWFNGLRRDRKENLINLSFGSFSTGEFILSISEEDAIALMEKLIKLFEKKKKYKYPYEGGRKK